MEQEQNTQPVYDLSGGTVHHEVFLRLTSKCPYAWSDSWPFRYEHVSEVFNHLEKQGVVPIKVEFNGDDSIQCVLRLSNGYATVNAGRGTVSVTAKFDSYSLLQTVQKELRGLFKPHSIEDINKDEIPVAFWAYGANGPFNFQRDLAAQRWEDIESNYSAATQKSLSHLMDPEFRPGRGGQLLLWHGEPGSGKTTAIRALAQSWKKWARLHYITDPDEFFGSRPDYMLQVMLQEEASPFDILDWDENSKRNDKDKEPLWRVLILEDAGELIQRDAKRQVGQALSRFLNSVDGLIGQGLRILTLVTTNEGLDSWHPAVMRYGRAMATIPFEALNSDEATKWLKEKGVEEKVGSTVLSDLYAKIEIGERNNGGPKKLIGFA